MVERENSCLQAALYLPHMCHDRCAHEHICVFVCVCKCRLIFSMSFQDFPMLSPTHLYTFNSHSSAIHKDSGVFMGGRVIWLLDPNIYPEYLPHFDDIKESRYLLWFGSRITPRDSCTKGLVSVVSITGIAGSTEDFRR